MQSKGDIPRAQNAEVDKMSEETIDFMTATGRIEESAGRRKFQIPVESDVRGFEKKILCSGECRHTIPMHFITEDQKLTAFYDFTGYMQLKDYAGRKIQNENCAVEAHKLVEDVLMIFSGILDCIKGMESYLILPDRAVIHPDVVLIDLNTGRAALAFYPNESQETTLQSRIIGLARDLSGLFHSDEADQYLLRIEEFIVSKNPGLDGMISYLGSIQREVSYIYWNTKNFRSIEAQDAATNQEQAPKCRSTDFRLKAVVVQLIVVAGVLAVYLSGKLSPINFAGFAIIAGAIDLLTSRKLFAMLKSM
jgi:hypothetical protein